MTDGSSGLLRLGFCEPFAVRLGTAQPVEQYVQVAKHGKKEGVVNPYTICDDALDDWKDCAADDCHVQDAGSTPG